VSAVLARVGDKWSVLIIMLLGDGPKTSMRSSGGISQRMLTLTLPGLQRPTIPPRVDYELTDLGRSLWKPVEALGSWAREHLTEIETAKRRFTSAPRRIERAG
jgi:DNA-binding HxlR family transcriptional regulator